MKYIQKIISFCLVWQLASAQLAFGYYKVSPIKNWRLKGEEIIFNAKGEEVNLENWLGNNILLVFWAKWCGGCSRELPILDKMQHDFRRLNLKILPLCDDNGSVKDNLAFYKEQQIKYLPYFFDKKSNLFKEFNVHGLPTAFLIDDKGNIKLKLEGDVPWHKLEMRQLILKQIDLH